jgi:hypothetical protein
MFDERPFDETSDLYRRTEEEQVSKIQKVVLGRLTGNLLSTSLQIQITIVKVYNS